MIVATGKLDEMSVHEDTNESMSQKRMMVELHDSFSSQSSIRIVEYDDGSPEIKESMLTEYLKRKYNRRKSKRSMAQRSSMYSRTAANNINKDDNFKLIWRCLSPMKKKTIFRSKSRSKNSSNAHSRSSSQQNSPSKLYKSSLKMPKTDLFYKNEMLNEIRTYIYSTLRRKILQRKHKENVSKLAASMSLPYNLKNQKRCSE